jgi:hypothetical protein
VTFGAAGDYTINLTVNDGVTSVTASHTVTVAATQPSIVETTDILPNIPAMGDRLRGIHQSFATNTSAFAIVGDETAEFTSYLDPFGGDPSGYTIDPSVAGLQGTIDRYRTDLGDGANSFNRQSVATGLGLIAEDLIRTASNPPCDGSETLIGCELRVVNPSVVIINIGYSDVVIATDPATFEAQMNQIVQEAVNRGVIPVLATIIPNPGDPGVEHRTESLNEAIINVATSNNIPLFNQWRMFHELPNNGLDGANFPSVAPEGEGFLSQNTTAGANTRNRTILTLLDMLTPDIFN